jgi:hypothetical protein
MRRGCDDRLTGQEPGIWSREDSANRARLTRSAKLIYQQLAVESDGDRPAIG